MSSQLSYINHLNESIKFEDGLYLLENELHDYTWNVVNENNRISYFERGIQNKSLSLLIKCYTRSNGISIINKLIEITEKDVLAQKEGRLVFDDYYMKCYITSSKKTDYYAEQGVLKCELNVATDNPYWVKEITSSFVKSQSSKGKNLDFPFDFSYDFTSPANINELINQSFTNVDFKLVIYGEVTDPEIIIGGNSYAVTGHIGAGQYLVINSKEKTITLVKQDGEQINWFSYRNKDNYIFTKIKSGSNKVSWGGNYGFEITLFEERSEPKWI